MMSWGSGGSPRSGFFNPLGPAEAGTAPDASGTRSVVCERSATLLMPHSTNVSVHVDRLGYPGAVAPNYWLEPAFIYPVDFVEGSGGRRLQTGSWSVLLFRVSTNIPSRIRRAGRGWTWALSA